jgi:hypothetical protein
MKALVGLMRGAVGLILIFSSVLIAGAQQLVRRTPTAANAG